MVAHGVRRQTQPCGDGGIAHPGRDQVEHLALTCRERGERRRDGPLGDPLQGSGGNAGTQHGPAPGHGMDGSDDVVRIGALEDVAHGSCPHGSRDRALVVVHGEHQDGHVRSRTSDPLGGLDARGIRQPDVQDEDVGPAGGR